MLVSTPILVACTGGAVLRHLLPVPAAAASRTTVMLATAPILVVNASSWPLAFLCATIGGVPTRAGDVGAHEQPHGAPGRAENLSR